MKYIQLNHNVNSKQRRKNAKRGTDSISDSPNPKINSRQNKHDAKILQEVTNLEAWMKFRTIPRQEPKAAVLHQIPGIIIYRFWNKCFKYLLHFQPGQSIHPAYLDHEK